MAPLTVTRVVYRLSPATRVVYRLSPATRVGICTLPAVTRVGMCTLPAVTRVACGHNGEQTPCLRVKERSTTRHKHLPGRLRRVA